MGDKIRITYYTMCDRCGKTSGPYTNAKDADCQPVLEGWLVTVEDVLCPACQDEGENEE